MEYSSKRILKNTIYLYIRSLFALVLNLYTSRQLLKVLGVEDYGVYSVVGGFVILFGFLNSSMSASSQRYLNYEMGSPEHGGVRRVFSSIINIQILISLLVFFLCQTIGLLFFYNYLNIPTDRVEAALFCMEFGIFTLIVNTLAIPYSSLLVAYENMKSFAYIDILGYVLNVIIVSFIEFLPVDKLIIYAFLFFCIQFVTRFLYFLYCVKYYSEAKYLFFIDKKLVREIFGFFSWTTLSGISYLLIIQGISILYNMFYGVLINAAIGIANQVNGAVQNLCNNFILSLFPQITKNYASQNYDIVKRLHFTGTKLAYVLLSLMAIPLIIDSRYILNLWLLDPPQYTDMFIVLLMLSQLMTFFAITSNTLVRASGKIRSFELIQNGIFAGFFVVLIFSFWAKSPIYIPYLIYVLSALIISMFKSYYSCLIIRVRFVEYLYSVYLRLVMFVIVTLLIAYSFKPENPDFFVFIGHVLFTIIIILLCAWVIVLTQDEKKLVRLYCINYLNNKLRWRTK